jgi:hypothetical protein
MHRIELRESRSLKTESIDVPPEAKASLFWGGHGTRRYKVFGQGDEARVSGGAEVENDEGEKEKAKNNLFGQGGQLGQVVGKQTT